MLSVPIYHGAFVLPALSLDAKQHFLEFLRKSPVASKALVISHKQLGKDDKSTGPTIPAPTLFSLSDIGKLLLYASISSSLKWGK